MAGRFGFAKRSRKIAGRRTPRASWDVRREVGDDGSLTRPVGSGPGVPGSLDGGRYRKRLRAAGAVWGVVMRESERLRRFIWAWWVSSSPGDGPQVMMDVDS